MIGYSTRHLRPRRGGSLERSSLASGGNEDTSERLRPSMRLSPGDCQASARQALPHSPKPFSQTQSLCSDPRTCGEDKRFNHSTSPTCILRPPPCHVNYVYDTHLSLMIRMSSGASSQKLRRSLPRSSSVIAEGRYPTYRHLTDTWVMGEHIGEPSEDPSTHMISR